MGETALIQRQHYLQKIKPFIGKTLIKVLVGQRRIGKSYLLLQIVQLIRSEDPGANFIFIDKEKFEFDSIRDYIGLVNYIESKKIDGVKNYLFIDEIQDITEFERALRNYVGDSQFDIYISGSNASLLSGELATLLSGRYIEFKIYSLSLPEFIRFHGLENSKDSLKKYLLWGGLPYLKHLPENDEIKFEYLENIFSTILYKDVISRYNIRNTQFLENLVRYLAYNTGNIVSAKRISDFLISQRIKMSPQIILNYLTYLQNAFLIFKVPRQNIKGRKVFEVNEKYYFEDWGLKNAITGKGNMEISQVIENAIFLHLKIHGYEVSIGVDKDREIDFVGEREGEKIYIQAAYLITDEKIRQREFGNLLAIPDNYRKVVLSLDEFTSGNYKGIEHIHLFDFLTKPTLQ